MEQRKAVVVLVTGEEINVVEGVGKIHGLVENGPYADPLFIQLTDIQGKAHEVNIRQIVEYREPPEPSTVYVEGD